MTKDSLIPYPCPRCGSEPKVQEKWYDNGVIEYEVDCWNDNCPTGWGRTRNEAITNWNKQPYIDGLITKIEQLHTDKKVLLDCLKPYLSNIVDTILKR